MLLDKGRITEEFIRIMDGWRHSGFNVFAGGRIQPREKKSLERLAAYLIRSSFSQRRMEYLPHEAKVRYESKDGKEKKTTLPWNGWPPWGPTSRIAASNAFVTTAATPTPPGAGCANDNKGNPSPLCWSR
jgi:hypothetical protein